MEKGDALPETNMAPENGWLEDGSFWEGLFSGAMLVLGRVPFGGHVFLASIRPISRV